MRQSYLESAKVLDPLNPDHDGDGLREGQEAAGWKVLVWREITMKSVRNYSVTSNPLAANNDGDADGDGFSDLRDKDADNNGLRAAERSYDTSAGSSAEDRR